MTQAVMALGRQFRGFVMLVALCTVLSPKAPAALGQSGPIGFAPTTGQEAAVAASIAAVGVGIGVGVFLVVRHNHMLTGCTTSTASGLTLRKDSDGQRYNLLGGVADIKPGERVQVSGKKGKDAGGGRTFLVQKLSKELGPCKAASSTP